MSAEYPVGRPTQLTPEVADNICKAIRTGAYMETAAAFQGIDKSTLHRWLREGARDRRTGKPSSPLAEFQAAVTKAVAEAELIAISGLERASRPRTETTTTTVEEVAPPSSPGAPPIVTRTTTKMEKQVIGDWRADAWRLERKFPDRYGPALRLKLEAEKRVEELLERLGNALPPETYRQVLAALEGVALEGDEDEDSEAPAAGDDGP